MIGLWIVRYDVSGRASRQLTKAHLVESEIVERKVVRCGRQMDELAGTQLTIQDSPPAHERCKVCAR